MPHITGEKIVFKQQTSDHKIKFYLAFSRYRHVGENAGT